MKRHKIWRHVNTNYKSDRSYGGTDYVMLMVEYGKSNSIPFLTYQTIALDQPNSTIYKFIVDNKVIKEIEIEKKTYKVLNKINNI